MTSLDRIAQAVAAYNAKPSPFRQEAVDKAYAWAADVIAGTYKRPDKPVISETTPPWIARKQV